MTESGLPGQINPPAWVIEEVCAGVNPLCREAYGRKQPDIFAGKSSALTLEQNITLTSDSTYGSCGLAIFPNALNAGFATPTTWSAPNTVSAWSYQDYDIQDSVTADFDYYRVIGFGLCAESILASDVNSGTLMIMSNQVGYNDISTYPNASSTRSSAYEMTALSSGKCAAGFATMTEMSSALNFQVTSATSMDEGWESLFLYATGLPVNSSGVRVRVTYHMELVVEENGTYIADLQTDAEPYDNKLMELRSRVSSKIKSVRVANSQNDFNRTIYNDVKQAIKAVYQDAKKWLGSNATKFLSMVL